MLSRKLMERFTKDCKIPIKIYEPTEFIRRIELYDKYYNSVEKWNAFYNLITSKYPNEEAYFAEYNKTKDNAINFIKETEGYNVFNNLDMNAFAIQNKGFPSKDIFHPSNIGRRFISIDMKKANFNSLRYYDESIFDNAETWEDFLRLFTSIEYIVNSKYIREVILGNCNPKRHITYEKWLMDQVLTSILNKINNNSIPLSVDNIVFFSNDEIIVDITNLTATETDNVYDALDDIVSENPLPFRIEKFVLQGIRKNNETIIGYIRKLDNGEIDFKCVNSFTLPFIIRALNNEPVTDNDKMFEYEGSMAMLLDTPQIKIV